MSDRKHAVIATDLPDWKRIHTDELAALRAENAALLRDREQLLRFAWGALLVHGTGNDWYGGDLQDHLEACGLLEQREMAAPCHAELCGCAAVTEFPCTCYRHTALGIKARDAAMREETP